MSGGAAAVERHDVATRRALVTAAMVLALAGVIAVLVTRVGRSYLPLGDEANIDLRVRDVFTGDTPLVGAYSRGFNHPGPVLFWLLAPLSAVTGAPHGPTSSAARSSRASGWPRPVGSPTGAVVPASHCWCSPR